MPPFEPDHRIRPGGGTYPVRAASTAPHPEPVVPRPTRAPRPGGGAYATHTSPKSAILIILGTFALLTLILVGIAVRSYFPHRSEPAQPAGEAAPDANAAAPPD